MKIAVLSYSFLTPEHISRLKELGEVVEYQSTNSESDAIERMKDVDVVVADCWDVPLNKNVLSNIPSVKYISLNSTGYNQVDLESAKQNGVPIANVPGFSTESVAEHTLGLLLALVRKIPKGNKMMHTKPFQVDPFNEAHGEYRGLELRGKVLGIIGLGAIGTRVAEIAHALGMKVIAYTRTPKNIPYVQDVTLDTLFAESDVISIHSALVDESRGLLNVETFKKMKPGVFIVNAARGEFANEVDMLDALKSGIVAGYGCDFVADWSTANPLLGREDVILTPHSAFFSDQSVKNMADIIVGNVESYVAGKLLNVVS